MRWQRYRTHLTTHVFQGINTATPKGTGAKHYNAGPRCLLNVQLVMKARTSSHVNSFSTENSKTCIFHAVQAAGNGRLSSDVNGAHACTTISKQIPLYMQRQEKLENILQEAICEYSRRNKATNLLFTARGRQLQLTISSEYISKLSKELLISSVDNANAVSEAQNSYTT